MTRHALARSTGIDFWSLSGPLVSRFGRSLLGTSSFLLLYGYEPRR